MTCTASAAEYTKNKRAFLAKRFAKGLDADLSEDEAAPWGSVSTALVDSRSRLKVNRPLVENKCRSCHAVLPKAIKVEGRSERYVVVTCTNRECNQPVRLKALPVDNEEDDEGKNIFHVSPAYTVTADSKGQPFYEGGSIQTDRARRQPNDYSQDGWWHFNDMGNFQPFFPPAPCRFTLKDRDVRDEPNIPINHTRTGLVPCCLGCGLFGVVVDDEYDVVMAQSGPDMEGSLAGAGAGNIVLRA
ncbi:uncharacterized protein BKCO1_20000133 [Diplodia corticola]|uniref:Uncharacterized protein n=1 Tax=Diplodia corticola TaxID=236234 RepID=A0A1J9R2N1_9PEZI|nr:uncharacterized protein BKCO1_20000133 [Diplodia corticola]OJD34872.1 hypothetical protein BKCO1_20000133 [Diplodia corticola]